MKTYVSNLQNLEAQRRSKFTDKAFKIFLGVVTIFVVLFILISFTTIIIEGIRAGNQTTETDWTEILFGDTFRMPGEFAMGIIIVNTIWMSILVLLVATPISIATALLITRVLPKNLSVIMISIVSILAAIPSVVYGAFGKYFLVKFLYENGLASEATDATLLAIVIVISIMVMPTITLMSTTSIMMVDRKLVDSSTALGATKSQTSIFIVLRSAKTGIIIGMLFALGRCLGEATAISMMTGTTPNAHGATFSLFEVSLFMSPMIMNAFAQQGTYPSYVVVYEVLSALLLIVILILFLFVKYLELMTDDNENSKKQSKKAIDIYNINKKVSTMGAEELTNEEGRRYASEYKRQFYQQKSLNNPNNIRWNELSMIRSRTSLDNLDKESRYKKAKSKTYSSLIIILSMAGILSLVMILGFLFNVDLSLLFNWEYWTLKGRYIAETGEEYWGIAIPLFGTMASVVVALSIALPLGIAIAVFVDTYLKTGSPLSKVVGFSFQIMTSIPAVIYGTLALIIFAYTDWINTSFIAFKPMFMLAIVILPTIIKQTTEGFRNVSNSQTEGSLALGATNAYTSRRIVISQAMPAILAAAILAISIVMADSAIFITILKTKPESWVSPSLWLENGGYTLSTNIYWISRVLSSEPTQRATAILQIKTTGIILMIFIFWLSLISQKIRNGLNKDALFMTTGIVMFSLAPFIIDGGIYVLFIGGAMLGIIGLFFEKFIERILRN